ncbi:NYN domain-containing protein [Crossiella sp. CA198]|uniref:NYN domain-containing protein n=1 Tax=Crossiella sp. CA198 TaxID=3455607 RepID=UPI003F8D3DE3
MARTGDPVPYRETDGAVAVFLDFENLVLGAGVGAGGPGPEPIPDTALRWLCRGFGNASIRRAYADWRDVRFGRYEKALATNGVDLVQMGRFTPGSHKNAADIRLAVDAMETLITHPEIGVFILITGDSDFTPLVQRLREFGKHVVGVGTETSASSRLVSVCSQYKFWPTLVRQADPVGTSGAATTPSAPAVFDLAAAHALLVRAIEQVPADTPTAAAVKLRMRSLDPAFDEANYGYRRFRDFLDACPLVAVAGRSGSDITLILTAPASTVPRQADH